MELNSKNRGIEVIGNESQIVGRPFYAVFKLCIPELDEDSVNMGLPM